MATSRRSEAVDLRAEAEERSGIEPGQRYRRVVVKLGTSLLTGGADRLDPEVMASLVAQVVALHREGRDVLVVSSGAVAAGRHALEGWQEREQREGRAAVPLRQALAAVGQSRLMHAYEQLFAQNSIPVAQALLTRGDVADRVSYLNIRNLLLGLCALRVVTIINENDVVAVEELEGEVIGDNDTLSALVANIVDADLLVLLGDVDGLYTADPHTDADARLVPVVEDADAVEARATGSWGGRGRGGMVTKLGAARLATASGTTVVIAGGRVPDVLTRLADGEALGTTFPSKASHKESRQRWMLSVITTQGALVVDAGAVRALHENGGSLLPAGVFEVRGTFQRGEVAPVLGPGGERVAAGIVNYDAADVRRILGTRSDRIAETLGHHYGDEVIHRNNMVPL